MKMYLNVHLHGPAKYPENPDTGYINPSKTEYKIWTESQTKNIVKQQFTQQLFI